MNLLRHDWGISAELARTPPSTGRTRPPPREMEHQEEPPAEQTRILVVEDEYYIADQIEGALFDAGYDVVGCTATAEQAIEIAEAARPDLVIMDIRLAGKRDGIDAAAELLERWGIRCVFATAHDDPATRSRGEAVQPAGWLSKPLSSRKVVDSVRRALALIRRPKS